jgi:hypothetical protein
MNIKNIFSLIFTISFFTVFSFSQDTKLIDSLRAGLNNFNLKKPELKNNYSVLNDSTAANILFQLSKAYYNNNLDTSMYYAQQTLSFSEHIGYKKGIAKAYNIMGSIHNGKGNYLQAMELYKDNLKIKRGNRG